MDTNVLVVMVTSRKVPLMVLFVNISHRCIKAIAFTLELQFLAVIAGDTNLQ